jgi:hypothetical protein
VVIAAAVAGYLYYRRLEGKAPELMKAIREAKGERKRELIEQGMRNGQLPKVSTDPITLDLGQIGVYALMALGLTVLLYVTGFLLWAWIGSGLAVRRARRRTSS